MASAFRDIKVAAESKIKNKKIHIYFKGSSALAPSLSLNSLGQSPLKWICPQSSHFVKTLLKDNEETIMSK
jgi:hypothetical protein